jgi:hypothetical protein
MTTTDPISPSWGSELVEQLDWHWQEQLQPRLEGLTDAEYLWRPTSDTWSIHPRGDGATPIQGGSGDFTIDFAHPEPDPAPVTTIAWRLGHVIVGVLAARVAGHFGGPAADYMSWDYAGTADRALTQLDEAYAGWTDGARSLDDDALRQPCGPAEGPWADHPMSDLVLHINREVIHHGAEIALLRDLYVHRS